MAGFKFSHKYGKTEVSPTEINRQVINSPAVASILKAQGVNMLRSRNSKVRQLLSATKGQSYTRITKWSGKWGSRPVFKLSSGSVGYRLPQKGNISWGGMRNKWKVPGLQGRSVPPVSKRSWDAVFSNGGPAKGSGGRAKGSGSPRKTSPHNRSTSV